MKIMHVNANNPLHPIKLDDYPKLFNFILMQSLIIKNPEYEEGLYKTHIDFIKKS